MTPRRAAVRMRSTCKINPHILRWIEMVEGGEIVACKGQVALCAHVRKCFETEDIYTDDERLEKYLGLAKYLSYDQLFPWEPFCLALHLCTFKRKDGRPRWPKLFLLGGRGLGKDGYIALESFGAVSPYNPIKNYDVDICANVEEQATRPLKDIIDGMEDQRFADKLQKHFYWTKEYVRGLKYGGSIRGRTNNAKNKDGMRSGLTIFNEIHQYEDYANIRVFKTGKGKVAHPRELYATTNGDVRDGPLDEMLAEAGDILFSGHPDGGMLPVIFRLDDKAEVDDPAMWPKANPSLLYLPDLMDEVMAEYAEWKKNPTANSAFMTKRMNLPQSEADVAVTDWENIAATNTELPDMRGWSCTAGIDYATVTDFASLNLHFRKGVQRFDLSYSWLCLKSKDLFRMKCPWREWAGAGMLTLVDEPQIPPALICAKLQELGAIYDIKKLAIDNYRYALFAEFLDAIGFDAKNRKNVWIIHPSDIMKIVPVIDSLFTDRLLCWGDNPVLRWATNNTKLVKSGRKTGTDTGNQYYAKIEGKSRKTDPFMALVASVIIEDELPSTDTVYEDIPVITL